MKYVSIAVSTFVGSCCDDTLIARDRPVNFAPLTQGASVQPLVTPGMLRIAGKAVDMPVLLDIPNCTVVQVQVPWPTCEYDARLGTGRHWKYGKGYSGTLCFHRVNEIHTYERSNVGVVTWCRCMQPFHRRSCPSSHLCGCERPIHCHRPVLRN